MSVTIPKPCNQQWDTFEPSAWGRHCSICNSEVVDFTHWKTADVMAYVQQSNSRVCGRINKISSSRQKMITGIAAFTILSLLPKFNFSQQINSIPDSIVVQGTVSADGGSRGLYGYLTNNYTADTAMVINGEFKFKVADLPNRKKMIINTHFLGYNQATQVVYNLHKPIEIRIEDTEIGEIIIKRSLKYRVKRILNMFNVQDL